jgi:hypothetical protein
MATPLLRIIVTSAWNPSNQGDAQCHHSNRTCVKFLNRHPLRVILLRGKASEPFSRSKRCYLYLCYSGPQALDDEQGTINGLCLPETMILCFPGTIAFPPEYGFLCPGPGAFKITIIPTSHATDPPHMRTMTVAKTRARRGSRARSCTSLDTSRGLERSDGCDASQ